MHARLSRGLLAATLLAILLPVGAAASGSSMESDNPHVDCDTPLPASVVAGELGTTVQLSEEAEIDMVTLASPEDADVVDADWDSDGHEGTIVTSGDVTVYVVWSCAPVNGEPVQQNEYQEV